MADIMAMDTVKAVELRQRMEQAALDLDWDAQALTGPMAEASALLGTPVPDVAHGARRLANELRDSAEDLQERTRIILAGGSEMNQGLAALERIRASFTRIESRGDPTRADGLLSRRDLHWARHSTDEETAAAAAWLLENNRFFDQVETALHNNDYLDDPHDGRFAFDPDDRDGHMSLDDIDAFLEKSDAWARLLPYLATIDDIKGSGVIDGFISESDLRLFLNDYSLSPEVTEAVQKVLADRAYHTKEAGLGLGTVLDAVSFVPVVGDVVDGARAIYYAVHGDYFTASLFALGLVPLPGLSASGARGAIRVVNAVVDTARTSGRKAAAKEAAQFAAKGTAANYIAYASTKQVGSAYSSQLELDDSVEYLLDDVAGPQLEDSLDVKLNPRMRRMLGNTLEDLLENRLTSGTVDWMSQANQVIAARIAEHKAHNMNLPRIRPG